METWFKQKQLGLKGTTIFHQQKLDLKRTMGELGKPFAKKSDQKFKKKLKIRIKMPHMKKNH